MHREGNLGSGPAVFWGLLFFSISLRLMAYIQICCSRLIL
jgi:hypothetical protein